MPDVSFFPLVSGASSMLPLFSAILLGLGLAAASGLRTFLPLLLLCASAKFGIFGIGLSPGFSWLASDTAFFSLLFAALIETVGDKIPVVDHLLDTIGTFLRPLAATLGAAAVLNTQDPAVAALLGLMLGAPLALGVHGVKATTRGASTLSTAGVGNPILSLVEDCLAFLMAALSLFSPLLVPLILISGVWLSWKLWRTWRHKKSAAA